MILSRKVEIQPTAAQRQRLLQHAGCARWAWNWGLQRKREAWAARKAAIESGVLKEDAPKIPSAIDLHRELTSLKVLPQHQGGIPWMYHSSKCAPQMALRNLDLAYAAFFRRCKIGQTPGFPKFKSRSSRVGGFQLSSATHVIQHTIKLPKIGWVRMKPGERNSIQRGTYKSVSVTEHVGRWFVSVMLHVDATEISTNSLSSVGVDLGVTKLAVLSNGVVYENPQATNKNKRRLRRAQKSLSRKKKGSNRRISARARAARIHCRIANLRKDATHKATTEIAKNHGVICIEDLKVVSMTRKRSGRGRAAKAGLNRCILDANFYEFRRQLEYKAKLHGAKVVIVSPAYTSQKCSTCGYTDTRNRLLQAVFQCLDCGHTENADLNAAKNILVAGSCPETLNARGVGRRPRHRKMATQLTVNRESARVVECV